MVTKILQAVQRSLQRKTSIINLESVCNYYAVMRLISLKLKCILTKNYFRHSLDLQAETLKRTHMATSLL